MPMAAMPRQPRMTCAREISERIDYYVGNNNASTTDDRRQALRRDGRAQRARPPAEVLERLRRRRDRRHVHRSRRGRRRRECQRETVSQRIQRAPIGADNYGNWYRQDVEEIADNGGAISGIGVQYYPLLATGTNAHSPARIRRFSRTCPSRDCPFRSPNLAFRPMAARQVQQAATYLEDTMRMVFGTPDATDILTCGVSGRTTFGIRHRWRL